MSRLISAPLQGQRVSPARLVGLMSLLALFACSDSPALSPEPATSDEESVASATTSDASSDRAEPSDTLGSPGDTLLEGATEALDADTSAPGPNADNADPEALPPCLAEGVGQASLHDPTQGVTLLEYSEPVSVQATHLEPGGCLSALTFTWSRSAGCELTLAFAPGAEGIWQLQHATLEPGDDCGAGGSGGGSVTLSEVPETTASSPPPYRCTVLWGPIIAHGVVELSSAEEGVEGPALHLEGLGVEGMLLSEAVELGVCGVPYTPCAGQSCGTDPLLGTSCGTCGESAVCEGGVCKEVAPVIAVCQRVLDDRAGLFEGDWTGSSASCEPGTMSADWRDRALRSTNLYRWIAGQPPLSLSTAGNASMQECALMMHAAGSLSHNPADSWPCYSEGGAAAAGTSNLAPVPAVESIDLYMADPGNATTIGHRRWILSDWISSTAFGSTSESSCMNVVQGFGGPTPWIAWPPPGFYPMELHHIAYQTVDQTGWTIQTNSLSVANAEAQVSEDGVDKPVEAVALLPYYGSQGALKITPQGWTIQAGSEYSVTVNTPSETIAYSFLAVDCQALLNP